MKANTCESDRVRNHSGALPPKPDLPTQTSAARVPDRVGGPDFGGTMRVSQVHVLCAAIAASLIAPLAHAAPACDDRINISNPDRVPFQWNVGQRQDADLDGIFDFISSGTLVGPHLVLTCGHCAYNRSDGHKALGSFTIAPAMNRDNTTDTVVYPHGTRVVTDDKYKVTNNKWVDPTYSPEAGVDYGGLNIVCPFEDITTYMPVVFDVDPSFVNISGYPIEDLPDPSNTLDQWRGAGDVTDLQDRIVTYDVRSTGGASGAPVWLYNQADGRRMVALNRGHSTECNGLGPRLVWNNENLITTWMAWRPSGIESVACASPILRDWTFNDLRDVYLGGQRELLSRKTLRLNDPPATVTGTPKRRVYQWIENTFYAWEEYAGSAGGHYLRMTRPQQRILPTVDAQVLLSASQSWQGQVASGRHTTFGPHLTETPLAQPIDTPATTQPDITSDRSQ